MQLLIIGTDKSKFYKIVEEVKETNPTFKKYLQQMKITKLKF
jgi:hypothetical protein